MPLARPARPRAPHRTARHLARVATLAAAAGACASAGGVGGAPAAGSLAASEDRVLIGDFSEVSALAVSQRYAFAATQGGLAVYDRQFARWLPPLTRDAGYPPERVTLLAADPASDGVWIGGTGELLFYSPATRAVTRALVGGIVRAIMFDRRDPAAGAYVVAGGGVLRVSESGFAAPASPSELPPPGARVTPPTLDDLYREFPSLQASAGLLTRGGDLRSYQVTAGARSPDRSEVWLGTWGGGVFQVDPVFNQATAHPYGLLTPGAGALALAADGVWIAPLASGVGASRGGLTFASEDLQQWRWLDGGPRAPLAGARAYDVAVRDGVAWIATDRGLARLDTRAASATRDTQLWTSTSGLPDDRVLAVAPRADAIWVGTARGLAAVVDETDRSATGRTEARLFRGPLGDVAVRALLFTGDTLWAGTEAGLVLLPPNGEPVRPSSATAEPRLLGPVYALARGDSVVVVATDRAVLVLHVATGRPVTFPQSVDFAAVGTPVALALDGATLWVGGRGGVLIVSRQSGVSRLLPASTLAGEVTDIALTDSYAWVAGTRGVVRLRRAPDGMVR